MKLFFMKFLTSNLNFFTSFFSMMRFFTFRIEEIDRHDHSVKVRYALLQFAEPTCTSSRNRRITNKYPVPEGWDTAKAPAEHIEHLVLVVHGIGEYT